MSSPVPPKSPEARAVRIGLLFGVPAGLVALLVMLNTSPTVSGDTENPPPVLGAEFLLAVGVGLVAGLMTSYRVGTVASGLLAACVAGAVLTIPPDNSLFFNFNAAGVGSTMSFDDKVVGLLINAAIYGGVAGVAGLAGS